MLKNVASSAVGTFYTYLTFVLFLTLIYDMALKK